MAFVLLNIALSWKIAFAAFPSPDRFYGWAVRVVEAFFSRGQEEKAKIARSIAS